MTTITVKGCAWCPFADSGFDEPGHSVSASCQAADRLHAIRATWPTREQHDGPRVTSPSGFTMREDRPHDCPLPVTVVAGEP